MAKCIFCGITEKTVPSYGVYEDADWLAILDKFPAAPGHVIVMPKKHCESIHDLPDELGAKLFPLIKKLAIAVKTATGCAGINIIQNNGERAGQTVPHFHVHIIPRSGGDGIRIAWEQTPMTAEGFEEMQDKLSDSVKNG